MQVDDNFRLRIKKIQEEIMRKQGRFQSIPKITQEMIKFPEWELMEKKLLGDIHQLEFRFSFDGRKKQ